MDESKYENSNMAQYLSGFQLAEDKCRITYPQIDQCNDIMNQTLSFKECRELFRKYYECFKHFSVNEYVTKNQEYKQKLKQKSQ
ncbi:hypothetical protein pb186bvf_020789 [Paramecium bursaria]